MLEALKHYLKPETEVAEKQWHSYSPDAWYLEQHPRQNIFIADDLKRGKINNKLIEDHQPIHPTCYTLECFTVWIKDLGEHSYPLILEQGQEVDGPSFHVPELARIRGELYSLPSTLFTNSLDIHKENTVKFIRKRVSITLPYRYLTFNSSPDATWAEKVPSISNDHLRTVRAWMYVANPEYWRDLIGSHLGSKAAPIYQHETPKVWIDQYYKF